MERLGDRVPPARLWRAAWRWLSVYPGPERPRKARGQGPRRRLAHDPSWIRSVEARLAPRAPAGRH